MSCDERELRQRGPAIGTLAVMIRRRSSAATGRDRVTGARRPLMVAGAALAVVLLTATCSAVSDRSSSAAATSGPHRTGSLVQADALGNTVIGGSDRTALAFRFRAAWTGSAVAARFYVITNVNGRSGYSSGNGGTMRVSLRADSGHAPHRPVGRELASATFRPAAGGVFPLVRFGDRAHIVAGRLYHVVFTNTDPDPARNYVSINGLFSESRLGRGPAVPSGMAVLERDRGDGGWEPRRSSPHEFYLPILEIVGARDSQRAGLGYMEVWDPKPIGGDAGVRQLLRLPAGRAARVTGAWLRVRRDDGSDAPLVIRLARADGTALASATLAARSVPTSDAGWVHATFAAPVSVAGGTDLTLTASASQASSYSAFPIRKGVDYGFDTSTYFDAGYAQFNTGSGWLGWDQWGGHDRHDSDLQFALDVG
jgi:hypothetical protein